MTDNKYECIYRLFEKQTQKTPERIAVVYKKETYTYNELNRKANHIAHHLKECGLRSGEHVAVCCERTPLLIAALLATQKTGGIYVPLDPEYPDDRLSYMLQDCAANILIYEKQLNKNLVSNAGNCPALIDLSPSSDFFSTEQTENLELPLSPENPIYTIYTSGSTGKPKGSIVYQYSFHNLLNWYCRELKIGHDTNVLLMTSFSFDLTQKNIYAPLITGGCLYLPDTQHYDASVFLKNISDNSISLVNCTPSAFYGFLSDPTAAQLEKLSSLQHVVLGGEPIISQRLTPWIDSTFCNATIVNSYGPTECTDVVSFHTLKHPDNYSDVNIPIGTAIDNTELLILSSELQPVSSGQEGEICIAGICLGGGYLNRPEYTAERFRPNPADPTRVLYLTGDRGRLRPDGNIEYLGRIDQQVKVRGFRIELGEIEAKLEAIEAIKEAVVVARPDHSGDNRLVAYLIRATDTPQQSVSEIRSQLQQHLPDFMLPTAWVFLDKMPLNPNGKLDRKALPDPEHKRPELSQAYVPPRTPLENHLADIWKQLLNLDRIGIKDRFFELGGTSIRSIEFIGGLSSELGEAVPIATFFASPTIEGTIGTLEKNHSAALKKSFPDHQFTHNVTDRPIRPIRPSARQQQSGKIAVIGFSGRFPGATDVEVFWDNLCKGVESIKFVGDDHLRLEGVDESDINDDDYRRSVFCADNLDGFDADFFGIQPRDAELMDPQHRLFLELAWAALDNAGYADNSSERIGVFGGIARDAYLHSFVSEHPEHKKALAEFFVNMGNDKNFPATRIAYKLNLTGPAINIQTACSSSGVALHMACRSIQAGDCDIALVGGCRVIAPLRAGYRHVEGGPLSADGHVRPFDADATGMVRGSGGAFLVIKRVEDAQKDKDCIRGIILSTAVNNDGDAKIGFTAPGVDGQQEVIISALEQAQVSPDSIGYLEAHGTATALGDPIEVAAVTNAYRHFTDKSQFCRLGSVKSNIGHLDAGAAASSIIKVLLAMEQGQIPPSLNYTKPNPNIDFSNSPFLINTQLTSWSNHNNTPLRAGVSSFGLGGTNFHGIFEQAPSSEASESASLRPLQILTLSSKSEVSLHANLAGLYGYLHRYGHRRIKDIAYSLNTTRPEFSHRASIICKSTGEQFLNDIASPLRKLITEPVTSPAFYFPGGTRFGRSALTQLLNSEPLFRTILENTLHTLQGKNSPTYDNIIDYVIELPTDQQIFLFEYTLAQMWIHWGVFPSAVCGHGAGVVAAACIAEACSISEALTLLGTIANDKTGQHPCDMNALQIIPPRIPFLSINEGHWANCDLLTTPAFWTSSTENPPTMSTIATPLAEKGISVLLQMGEDSTSRFSEISKLQSQQMTLISTVGTNHVNPSTPLTEAVARLWSAGHKINWHQYYHGHECKKVPLPPYQFNRQRYWLDLPGAGARIFAFSAVNNERMEQTVANWSSFLHKNPHYALNDATSTAFPQDQHIRAGVVAFNNRHAGDLLSSSASISVNRAIKLQNPPSIAFMFPGGGSQHQDMGLGLYRRFTLFRSAIDEGLALYGALTGIDLKRIWFPADHEREWSTTQLLRPTIQLPAIFILGMALARLWQSWGLRPSALIGHSLGENIAACYAGVLSYEETLGLVILRGRIFERIESGGMLSVSLPADKLADHIGDQLDIAIINGPENCSISGPAHLLDDLHRKLDQEGIESQPIPIATAAHSRLLEPMLNEFTEYLRNSSLKAPQIPIVSNLTGNWLTDQEAINPQYWADHLRHTVQFSEGIKTLTTTANVFVETGPGKTLCSLLKSSYPQFGQSTVASLRHEREESEDQIFLLNSLCKLWLIGAPLSLAKINKDLPQVLLTLPAQPPHTEHIATDQFSESIQLLRPEESRPHITTGNIRMKNRKHLIEDKLKAIIEEMSGISVSSICSETTFLNMGFDSLFLTQANLRFKKAFNIKLSLRQLLGDAPTISTLSHFIDEQLPPEALQAELTEQQQLPQPDETANTPQTSQLISGSIPTNLQQAIAAHLQISNALLGLLQGGTSPAQITPSTKKGSQPVGTNAASGQQHTGKAHGPFVPMQKTNSSELTQQQSTYLKQFISDYQTKTAKSKALAAELRPHYADPRTAMGFKSLWKEITYTIAADCSKGSRVRDIDGNEYVDCMSGFGTIFFGHAPDFVLDAVHKQLDTTIDYGPQSAATGRVAKLFKEITGKERVSFCNTGSEAALAAMRIARTVTGNDLIVTFQGDYHGIFDEVLVRVQDIGGERINQPVAPGIPTSASQNILLLDYGEEHSLEKIRERGTEIAGVIVEPVQSRNPELQPKEFLHKLRKLTTELGIPLIFDEIITGFRLHPKGAQGWFDVEADIACYGKVVGGGFSIGIIAGKAAYMDTLDGGMWNFGDDSFPEAGVTYFAGTFIRHPVALAATEAVLLKLKEEGPKLQQQLNKRTAIFAETVNRHYRQMGVPVELVYFGSAFFIRYRGDSNYEGLFAHHLRYYGAHHIWGNRPGFLTTAHTDDDLAALVNSFIEAAQAMQRGGFLPAIDKAVEDFYPWTAVQREIWLAIKMNENASAAYNEQVMFEIGNSIDSDVMRLALDKVVNRHQSLRAVVAKDEKGLIIRQYISPEFTFVDLSGQTEGKIEEKITQLAKTNISTAFDLKKGPLIRGLLIKVDANKYILAICVHHLICDGWSLEITMEDIAGHYTGIMQSRHAVSKHTPDIKEYVKAESELMASDDFLEARKYWLTVYGDDLPENLSLPLDRPYPPFKTFSGERTHYYFDSSLAADIREFARENQCTTFVLLLAVYLLMLKRLSGMDDVVTGIPVAGQPYLGMTGVVTHAVSLLPLRNKIDESLTTSEFILRVRDIFIEAKDYQSCSYGELLKELPVPRVPGRLPLMSASFNVDMAFNPLHFDGVIAKFVPAPRSHAKVDILFTLTDEKNKILVEVDRNTDILDSKTIDHWVKWYEVLIKKFISSPSTPLQDIDSLSAEDQHKIFKEWNPPLDLSFSTKTFLTLIEEKVSQYPEKYAVICDQHQLGYAQLHEQSNQFATYLIKQGVTQGSRVGICVDRSEKMPVALLGILKAGAAYVPLDPNYPTDRLAYIAQDSGISHLVTQSDYVSNYTNPSLAVVLMDKEYDDILTESINNPGRTISQQDLVYIIYTSGSTGTPKGVPVNHAHVLNLLTALQIKPGITPDDLYLTVISLSFDPSVIDLFLPLITGATILVASNEECRDVNQLKRLMDQRQPTVMNATPSTWRFLVELNWQPQGRFKILCGGEVLTPELAQKLITCSSELWNMYGPTEATVAASCYLVTTIDKPIMIGKPLKNNSIYILDKHNRLVPPGVPGELHIGGLQVASGYLNQPALTAERFIPDPYSDLANARLYKTGDLARYHSDGVIEYLGRNDFQLKVRGNRVEPGEIEAAIMNCGQIRQAVVTLWNRSELDKRLIAYVVADDPDGFNPLTLRKALRSRLPEYMIPQHIDIIKSIPLTPNGKIDIKKLPTPKALSGLESSARHEDPQTEMEKKLATLWCELIGIKKVGVHDNFFDLGGHSLLSMQLMERVKTLYDVDLSPRSIMLSTLGQLAHEATLTANAVDTTAPEVAR